MAKKKEEVTPEAPKAEASIVERKISKDEILSLQIEGRLKSYNPATGIGKVASKATKVVWPGGGAKVE